MKIKNITVLRATFLLLFLSGCSDNNESTNAVAIESFTHKTFLESDFYFDSKTSPYKDLIINGVNKVHRENDRCREIDASSAYISTSKSTAENLVFFVTCTGNGIPFNVFFSQSDVSNNTTLSATKNINDNAAIQLCKDYVMDAVAHPSTVDFSSILANVTKHPNGRSTIVTTFTEKNSFDLELNTRSDV